MKKEEVAGRLRALLEVDVKFEKLTIDELYTLLHAVERLAEKARQAEAAQQQVEDMGPFGFGILPQVRRVAQTLTTQIMSDVSERISEATQRLSEVVEDARKRGARGRR